MKANHSAGHFPGRRRKRTTLARRRTGAVGILCWVAIGVILHGCTSDKEDSLEALALLLAAAPPPVAGASCPTTPETAAPFSGTVSGTFDATGFSLGRTCYFRFVPAVAGFYSVAAASSGELDLYLGSQGLIPPPLQSGTVAASSNSYCSSLVLSSGSSTVLFPANRWDSCQDRLGGSEELNANIRIQSSDPYDFRWHLPPTNFWATPDHPRIVGVYGYSSVAGGSYAPGIASFSLTASAQGSLPNCTGPSIYTSEVLTNDTPNSISSTIASGEQKHFLMIQKTGNHNGLQSTSGFRVDLTVTSNSQVNLTISKIPNNCSTDSTAFFMPGVAPGSSTTVRRTHMNGAFFRRGDFRLIRVFSFGYAGPIQVTVTDS